MHTGKDILFLNGGTGSIVTHIYVHRGASIEVRQSNFFNKRISCFAKVYALANLRARFHDNQEIIILLPAGKDLHPRTESFRGRFEPPEDVSDARP